MLPFLKVGIDPSPKGCVAVAVDHHGIVRGKPVRFAPDASGIEKLIDRIERRNPGATRHFFIEASAYFWYAPSGLLRDRGERVSLISPIYTAAQRKAISRHTKSDSRDAEAVARAPFNMGEKAYHPVDLPEGPRLNLRLLCRHRKRLQDDATGIKLRLFAWLGLTAPGLLEILGHDLSELDREFLRRYPVVAKILRLGRGRLQRFLEQRADGSVDPTLVDQLFDLAQRAYSPRDLDNRLVAEQIDMELKRLALLEQQIRKLDQRIDPLYNKCDPQRLARSLPGFGPVIAPIMVAEAGTDLSRFPSPDRFASWTGLVGKARGSAGNQLEGLPITKAGRDIVKWALHMAANIARQHDPQLRHFYDRLRAKAKPHNVAVTAVAHQLARRYWSVMTEQRPYEIRPPN